MSWKEALLNPGVLSALVAVPVVCDEHYAAFLFGGGSRVPFFFEHAAGYAGMRILYCGVDWNRFREKGVLYASLTRLVWIPLLTMLLYWVLGLHRWIDDGVTLVLVNLIAGACPAAIATSMMSARYGLDGEYASVIVAVTTVGCLVTVPLIAMLGQMIFV